MQIRLTTLAILLLLFFQSTAQDKTSLYLLIGGGPTEELGDALKKNTPSPSDPESYRRITKIGFSYGIALNHKFSDHFSLTGRLLSEGKGSSTYIDAYNYDFFTNSYTYIHTTKSDISITYLTLGLVPQYTFKKFNVGAGGYIGTPYKSTSRYDYINFSPPQAPSHFNSLSAFQQLDAGVVINIGYTIPIKDFTITFQASDSYGLKNILISTQVPAANLNNYSLLVGLSYSKINKKYFNKPK